MTTEQHDTPAVPESLRERYAEIEAPPWLLTRVRAALPRRRRAVWLPAGTAAAAAAIVAALAMVLWRPATTPEPPGALAGMPSLSAVGTAMADRGAPTPPGLGALRVPALPAPPRPPGQNPENDRAPDTDDSTTHIQTIYEERHHAHG